VSIKQVKEILKRTAAMTIAKISAVFTLGSVAGVSLAQNLLMTVGMGVLEVAEDLSKSYLEDGNLSDADINKAFKKAADKVKDK
jgi:hypothetical protein